VGVSCGYGERGKDGPFELGGLDVEVGLDALCELGLDVGAVAASSLASLGSLASLRSLRSLRSLGSLRRLSRTRCLRCLRSLRGLRRLLRCRCSESGTEEAEDGEGLHVDVCITRKRQFKILE